MRGLLGVADGEDDRVHALDREGVGLPGGVGGVCAWSQSWLAGSPRVRKVRNSSRDLLDNLYS